MDRAELLSLMRNGRERLEATLSRIDPALMETPGIYENWTVKDMLAHLGWWERRVATILSTLRRGDDVTDPIDGQDLDATNQKVYDEYHGKSLQEVRQFEMEAYGDLQMLVEAASDDELFDPQHFAWAEGEPFFHWIDGNTYGHYDEHLPALEALADQSGQGA